MRVHKLTFLLAFFLFSFPVIAQSGQGNNVFGYSMLILGFLVVFGIIFALTDNLMQLEAKNKKLDNSSGRFSLYPRISSLFSPARKSYTEGKPYHKLTKGFDIPLEGEAEKRFISSNVRTYAIQPPNFKGISPIPKVVVEIGDEVRVGDTLFFDKKRPDVLYASPVSGEIVEINRGDKRSIASVVILADKEFKYKKFDVPSIEKAERSEIMEFLKSSGGFVHIEQRPFDIIPDDDVEPTNIFISGFDTAPNAPDNAFIAKGKFEELQTGINLLNRLTDGKVYLGLDGSKDQKDIFGDLENAEIHYFTGKHPAGNVGVQIHHIAPIGPKDKVWTVGIQDLINLGSLINTGKYSGERIIALTGAQLNENAYVKTYIGAKISDLIEGLMEGEKNRIISGDVLSGKRKYPDDFMNFHDDQLTVIEEGDNYELFGWLLPVTPRPSHSGTFPNFLFKNHKFIPDTNTHGEKRAFVITGQYEDVLPMDIYPQHLIKAIMTGDIERMEGLGINELSEEDIAICEFVCTSKQPLQKILREGLDLMQEQG